MKRHQLALAVVLLLVPHLSACSFAFVRGPPAGHEDMAAFSCTASDAAPALDLLWLGYMTVAALAAEDASWGVADIAVGGVYASSVFYGGKTVARCRAAILEANRRAAAARARLETDGDTSVVRKTDSSPPLLGGRLLAGPVRFRLQW